MARRRTAREDVVERPARRPRPPWYRDLWPWLLVLGIVVLAGLGGYIAWQAFGDDDEGDSTVPQAVGLEQSEAIVRVQDAGFRVEVEQVVAAEREGRVAAQEPFAGTRLDRGETVTLSVSQGPASVTDVTVVTQTEPDETEPRTDTEPVETEPPRLVEVPDVVGQGHVVAGGAVEGKGLAADSYPVPGSDPRGTVLSQNPIAGARLLEGEIVRLNVSRGPPGDRRPTRRVPDVVGSKASDARASARRAGFTVRTVPREASGDAEAGEVLAQEPGSGVRAEDLTQITIFVAR